MSGANVQRFTRTGSTKTRAMVSGHGCSLSQNPFWLCSCRFCASSSFLRSCCCRRRRLDRSDLAMAFPLLSRLYMQRALYRGICLEASGTRARANVPERASVLLSLSLAPPHHAGAAIQAARERGASDQYLLPALLRRGIPTLPGGKPRKSEKSSPSRASCGRNTPIP